MKSMEVEQLKAAYALNLVTVSVSQIVDYNDVIIMRQEYDNILNNINLENIVKDDPLLEVIKKIMDTITFFLKTSGDIEFVELEYQHQVKNAVWSAVPSVGAIFATSNPVAIGLTLASQIGIGYMNYRRKKSDLEIKYKKNKWEIQENCMDQLNGLQKELFETAWRLADRYNYPDEYRITEKQIHNYNNAIIEPNLVKRYNKLNDIKDHFRAFPSFWYQLGSVANSIFRSDIYKDDEDIRQVYKKRAIEAYDTYYDLNKFSILRHDLITSAWALEYVELLDLNDHDDREKVYELVKNAEAFSGAANDILQLCAFEYLRIGDLENATRLFLRLVSNDYSIDLNTQVLSALYIKTMKAADEAEAKAAKMAYKELKNITDEKYILPIPSEELNDWNPEWNKENDDFIKEQMDKSFERKEEDEELKKKASAFYRQPTVVIYDKRKVVAEYLVALLNDNKDRIDKSLPPAKSMNIKDYKRNKTELEERGIRIILLGHSDEAKNIHKATNNGKWDFYKYGMRFVSGGNKTVMCLKAIEIGKMNDFIKYAEGLPKDCIAPIPSEVGGTHSLLREVFKDNNVDDPASVLATITMAPLLIGGEAVVQMLNGAQLVANGVSQEKIDFLRYSIMIYTYLKRHNALIPQTT